MKQQYRMIKFQEKNLILLKKIKAILEEYGKQEIRVTLRQLYYQLVARDIIPNKQSEYIKISRIIKLARYSGLIDWEAIEDRIREPYIPNTFEDVQDLLEAAVGAYQLDRWQGQDFYIELWTEKDALTSVISLITKPFQVSVCVNRGYNSTTAMYGAAQRFLRQDKEKIILYLGDHDASGLDMDRDIKQRLEEFGVEVKIIRIGLTMDQINQYSPPPNFAKEADPRAKWYIERHGEMSWEVDALRPEILQDLIKKSIIKYLDIGKFEQVQEKEKEDIQKIKLWGG